MKKLAIIGASYLQLPLVRKAKEMGLEAHCFAWADGAVCRDVVEYFYPISIVEKDGKHPIAFLQSFPMNPSFAVVKTQNHHGKFKRLSADL